MSIFSPQLRFATENDAATIAALAVQVFLDTYATEGVRPDLALEAFTEYSAVAFASRLQEPGRRFLLAEHGPGLIGFAEVEASPLSAPAGSSVGAELVRLYIQPSSQRRGLGQRLLREAEAAAVAAGLTVLWLTAWDGNHRARRFYARNGYQDVGATSYALQGNTYGNRVLLKHLVVGTSAA